GSGVRISVPAGSLTEPRTAEITRRATAVLAAADDHPDRLYQEPVAWVQVIDIAEGAWGALGRPVRFPEIASYVTTSTFAPASPAAVATRLIREAPPCL